MRSTRLVKNKLVSKRVELGCPDSAFPGACRRSRSSHLGLLDAWPVSSSASTSKEIILLSALEALVVARAARAGPLACAFAVDDVALDRCFLRYIERLAACIRSENWRLVEKGLHVWRSDDFCVRASRAEAASTTVRLDRLTGPSVCARSP